MSTTRRTLVFVLLFAMAALSVAPSCGSGSDPSDTSGTLADDDKPTPPPGETDDDATPTPPPGADDDTTPGDDDTSPTEPCDSADLPLHLIQLPAGFKICVWAKDIPAARQLALGEAGTVFVGTTQSRVYALRDEDGDHRAEKKFTIAEGLNAPNGVAFRDGDLYVGEISRITRYLDIESQLASPPVPQVVTTEYPTDTHHGTKFIKFGPDGKLYVPVGAPCNVCEKEDVRFASITRINADGSGQEIFARGIRNTVGFDWQPGTGDLWFTDNGRDWLGDDLPSDELNRAHTAGLHFGFPFCHQGDTLDPELGIGRNCADYVPPALKTGAHVAGLGMRFYTGSMFPAKYQGGIITAQHGSWNRSAKVGYRVMFVGVSGSSVTGYEPLATGWLQGEQYFGRPVDVQVLPDGSVLVSDDFAGLIYRISYN